MPARLQFEGIRCFSTAQDALVRPLTLLVGENSSGKSTFLALCQLASAITYGFDQEFPFNDPPFLMGAFDQIASYRGERGGRAKSFSIGISLDGNIRNGSIQAEFVSKNGQPSLRKWRIAVEDAVWQITRGANRKKDLLLVKSSLGKKELVLDKPVRHFDVLELPVKYYVDQPELQVIGEVFTDSVWDLLRRTREKLRQAIGSRTYALAPVRTFPQRTYNPVSAEPNPGGSHVPMLLALLARSVAKRERTALRAALDEFGANSGLYEHIEIVRKGEKESDPFQIGVKSGGPIFNLVDVGYGVSQALPILVDTLQRRSSDEVFLLQQPEVHLHPRAQAEVGSFFARMAGKNKRFVIETHSDYLIDRVRMEVRRGKLRPEDVSLLYFERQNSGAMIHCLELDKDGSITNQPESYRQFFLDEERQLLGI
jgi:AAA domain, putative AbiEii toxin, Type IV TA system